MSDYHINRNANSFNTNDSFNTITTSNTFNSSNNIIKNFPTRSSKNVWISKSPHKKAEILAWVSPLEPQIRHQEIRAHRVDEVGGGLLQTQEYQNWLAGIREGESDGLALFCYGDRGVGKTHIR